MANLFSFAWHLKLKRRFIRYHLISKRWHKATWMSTLSTSKSNFQAMIVSSDNSTKQFKFNIQNYILELLK